MNRRNFLTVCLAAVMAPAIVRASSLMPVRAYEPLIWLPDASHIREVTAYDIRRNAWITRFDTLSGGGQYFVDLVLDRRNIHDWTSERAMAQYVLVNHVRQFSSRPHQMIAPPMPVSPKWLTDALRIYQ